MRSQTLGCLSRSRHEGCKIAGDDLGALFEALESRKLLAGVTVITHGFQVDGNFPTWVDSMSLAVESRAGIPNVDTRVLGLSVPETGEFLPLYDRRNTGAFWASGRAEAIVGVDWADASNNSVWPYTGPLFSSEMVAARIANALLTTAASEGIIAPLAELPIHLIGHSRGGSAMLEAAELLGSMGIWVDQVTLLDPHPLAQPDAWSGGEDPPLHPTSNALFIDNYFQTATSFEPNGQFVPGSLNLDVSGYIADHSDVHTYYHGTVDTQATSDGDDAIRSTWYGAGTAGPRESFGFLWSRLGRGDVPTQGLLSQLGGQAVRPDAPISGAQWPNLYAVQLAPGVRLEQSGTVDVPFVFGDRDSGATVRMFFDTDTNPYNGSAGDAGSVQIGANAFASGAVKISANGVRSGTYNLGVEVNDGGRRRFRYATNQVTVDYVLYFPEGNSTGNINEYVPIVNPNDFAVNYTVTVHYEWGDREQVIQSTTIAPHSRGGLTIYEGANRQNSVVRLDTPYAIEIRSTGPLGATLAHYDYGVATGEAFSSEVSGSWSFASVWRHQGMTDYLVWYNPSDTDAFVTVTALTRNGSQHSGTWSLPAKRRGGIAVNDVAWPFDGEFAAIVTSTVPITAAVSHYEPNLGQGFIATGHKGSGSTSGYATFVNLDTSAAARFVLFNPTNSTAQITLQPSYEGGFAAPSPRTYSLSAGQSLVVTDSSLQIAKHRQGVVRYISDRPVVLATAVNDPAEGDGLGATTGTRASRRWLFGDAYMSNSGAGSLNIEYLTVVNPSDSVANVQVRFLFLDGTTALLSRTVQARSSDTVAMHQCTPVLSWGSLHGGQNWFSLDVNADRDVIASFVHWDQNQRGGWSSLGTPAGPLWALP